MLRSTLVLSAVFLVSCSSEPEKLPVPEKDFCSEIHCSDSTSLSKELETVKDSMKEKTGVYVLEDGGNSLVARAWLSEHAEKTIDIQYFIFSTDNVGLIACDYLVRAADRGVKVRILVDDMLVDAGAHEILTLDSHENISIKIYNPGTNLGKNIVQKIKKFAADFKGANQRMHNKTFTVDGTICITGGRNVADEYFDYDHEYNFRDRDVMLLGKTVQTVSASFEQFWNDTLSVPVSDILQDEKQKTNDSSRYERLHQYACNPNNYWPQVREKVKTIPLAFKNIRESGELVWLDSVSFVSDMPGKNADRKNQAGGITTDSLISLVNHAKTSIDIQSPYLITTFIGKSLFANA